MYINIDKILENRGKTRYWLSKETGITYQNIKKLADNKTNSIKFELIENICNVLECTPNDLFLLTSEK
ncbi:helix-turn-helix transcriptional regulator [Fusobacterium sp.]|uniref:helix-turn-helix domain-containing protein n=1 Tax=Fusobacterium sp. TaxID=68766 RepID=UPI002609DCCD|nr:helix-turn-helix transcriptional regulator [Fusobacterium sp.]